MKKLLPKKWIFMCICAFSLIFLMGVFRLLIHNRRRHSMPSSSLLIAKERIEMYAHLPSREKSRIFMPLRLFNKSKTDSNEYSMDNAVIDSNNNLEIKGNNNTSLEVQKTGSFFDDLSSVLETVNQLSGDSRLDSETDVELDVKSLLNRYAQEFCKMCSPPSNISETGINETQLNIHSPHIKVTVLTDSNMKESYFIPRPEVINDISFKYILHNTSLCTTSGGQKPFLLMLVPTVKRSVHTRKVIRETWGSLVYNGGRWGNFLIQENVRLLFFLGTSFMNSTDMEELEDEAQQFGDILLADFEDSYRNLSLKMAIGLSWIKHHCDGVGHVVKVDEDTFLHVPKLIAALKHVQKTYKSFVLGHTHMSRHPPVVRQGRWAVGPEYPMTHFPCYVYGHSYVVSGPAIRQIVRAFQHMPLVANEDAYITGILSKAANVTRLSNFWFAREFRMPMVCRVSDGHYVSVTNCCEEHLRAIYKDVMQGSCDWRFQYSIDAPGCRFFEYEHDFKNRIF